MRMFIKLWAPQAPPKRGLPSPPPKAAANGRRRWPKRGDEGATLPEGERNLAEGGYFASIYTYIYNSVHIHIFIYTELTCKHYVSYFIPPIHPSINRFENISWRIWFWNHQVLGYMRILRCITTVEPRVNINLIYGYYKYVYEKKQTEILNNVIV